MENKQTGKPDWILITSILIQIVIGSAFIYSVSSNLYVTEVRDPAVYFKQYLAFLFVSIVAASVFFRYVSIERIKKASYGLIGVAFILLAASLIPSIGLEQHGVSRWIKISSFTLFMTPVVMLFLIIGASRYLADHLGQNQIRSAHSTKIIITFTGLFLLLFAQPDSVTFCILTMVLVALCFGAGLYKQSALIAMVTFVSLLMFIMTTPYRRARCFVFQQPFEHQSDSTYQLANNLLMIGGGDLTGQGFGHGIITSALMKYTSFSKDGGFIFSSIVEETGFIGAFCLILCSLLILWRSFGIARKCMRTGKNFEGLIVIGIASWMVLLSVIHIAATTGLIPTANVYYPFVSYNNAYLPVIIFACALILKIGMSVTVVENNKDHYSLLAYIFTGLFLMVGYHTFQLSLEDTNLDHRYQQKMTDLYNHRVLTTNIPICDI